MGYLGRQIYFSLCYFLSLIISFSLALSPISALASPAVNFGTPNQRAVAEEAFFYDLRFRTEQFMNANLGKITKLRVCLKATMDPKSHRTINLDYCKNELDVVRNNIRVLYPRMRQYLIVRQLMTPTPDALSENFDIVAPSLAKTISGIAYNESIKDWSPLVKSFMSSSMPQKRIDVEFENPLDSNLDKIKMPFVQPTNAEMVSAIEGLRDNKGQVHEYGYGVSQIFKAVCLRYGMNDQICNSSRLKYNAQGRYTYWQTSLREVPIAFTDIFRKRHVREAMSRPMYGGSTKPNRRAKKLDEALEAKYFEIIQENPYVALVSSANPSNQALLWAFDQMAYSSGRTIERFKQFQQKLDQERSLFKRTIDWFKAEDTRSRTLELMNYAPIVGHVLEVPGSKMDLLPFDYPFQELAADLGNENSTNQFKKVGIQIVGLIAANVVVCWLPWSKAASTTGRVLRIAYQGGKLSKALKPMCFPLTNIPINTYFLAESVHDYTVAYEEIFSGMDQDRYGLESNAHFVREISSLTASKKAIFWSLLFMPVGTKEIRVAMQKNIPSLSKNAWSRIERYLANRKQ